MHLPAPRCTFPTVTVEKGLFSVPTDESPSMLDGPPLHPWCTHREWTRTRSCHADATDVTNLPVSRRVQPPSDGLHNNRNSCSCINSNWIKLEDDCVIWGRICLPQGLHRSVLFKVLCSCYLKGQNGSAEPLTWQRELGRWSRKACDVRWHQEICHWADHHFIQRGWDKDFPRLLRKAVSVQNQESSSRFLVFCELGQCWSSTSHNAQLLYQTHPARFAVSQEGTPLCFQEKV